MNQHDSPIFESLLRKIVGMAYLIRQLSFHNLVISSQVVDSWGDDILISHI